MVRDTKSFIEKSIEIHGNKYDYSNVKYINTNTKVTIICHEHGMFEQSPKNHLNNGGCAKCGKINRAKSNTKTLEKFIQEANIIHDFKYDYSKVNYTNTNTKVCIICPKHGEFEQIANNHLQGQGCPNCNKKSLEKFVEKAIEIHGNKYDYSKVKYENSKEKVCIICPEHGEFWQRPVNHLNNYGCSECGKIKKIKSCTKTTDSFIKKAKEVHGNKYDYSLVNYKLSHEKVKIICPIHGEFEQQAGQHILGHGCKKCAIENSSSNTKEFIRKARLVHGDRYDYSKVEYIKNDINIIVICRDHGEFNVTPNNHLLGGNCKWCNYESYTDTLEQFIEKANIVHDNKYDYSRAVYINSKTPIKIICKKHGEFEQTPNEHLSGSGCRKCILKSQTKLFNKLMNSFENNVIEWEYSPKWLEKQRFDIYLPDYNIAVEYNGEQHYKPVECFGGEEGFFKTQERDNLKRQKCLENNCILFEVKYDYDDNDYESLVNNIKETIKSKNYEI